MKVSCAIAVLATFCLARAGETSPIGKVLELLTNLESKISAEGEAAKKTYTEFSEWCEDEAKNFNFEIKTAKAEIEELKATIEKESAESSSLSAKIEELAAHIASSETDLKAATELRAKESADFAAEEKELVETIDILGRAVSVLSREMAKGGASMMQLQNAGNIVEALSAMVQASALSSADATKLTALVQSSQGSEEDSLGAPAAAVYESHSGNIVDTLESLQDKAQGVLSDARGKETTALHSFELLKQSLEDSIKFATKDTAAAKKRLAESSQTKAVAEGDLEVTSKGLDADTTSLADLNKDCMQKAQDYEAATASRADELKALAEAKQAVSDMTPAADTLEYGLNQVSFLQVARAKLSSGVDLANFEAVRVVRELARKHKSPALAQLASRMAAAMHHTSSNNEDPFAKVKGLISAMIDKLTEEAGADAEKKAYCDKEIAESEEKKAEATATVEKLTSKIDEMSAKSAQLKEEVAALQKGLAELAASQVEMNKMRAEEKDTYTTNKADMEQGIEGVKMALQVLREYYAKKDKAHAAAEGSSTGIIGMLEVVESDFSKSLAGMIATEESAAAEYEKTTKENEITKAANEADVKYKTKESTSLDESVSEASADRATTQTQLDAVVEYLGKLQEDCTSKVETYEERKARRESEIAGLKNALEILSGEAVLLQQKRRTLRGVQRHVSS